ncbi:MAG: hypothetical protein ABF633_01275 [Clostridium sp.]|uniref:hypothetical protein n=1 Tax=Clostridium sp. TaxID=1506 RepID=UPI0039E8B5A6
MKCQIINSHFKDKFIQKIYLGLIIALSFIAITTFSGATNVHADTWSVTLPAFTLPTQGRTYYCTQSNSGKISLTRIVDGPSYYVRAQMINSNGDPRTGEALVQQGAGYTNFPSSSMSYSYYYSLLVENDYFETTARSAYGYIDISSTK